MFFTDWVTCFLSWSAANDDEDDEDDPNYDSDENNNVDDDDDDEDEDDPMNLKDRITDLERQRSMQDNQVMIAHCNRSSDTMISSRPKNFISMKI